MTTFLPTPIANGGGYTGYTIRNVISLSAAGVSGDSNKIRLFAPSLVGGGGWTITKSYVGQCASGGSTIDFTGTPTQVLWGGNATCTVPSSGGLWSDWIDIPNIADTKNLLISILSGSYNPPYKYADGIISIICGQRSGDYAANITVSSFYINTYFFGCIGFEIDFVSPSSSISFPGPGISVNISGGSSVDFSAPSISAFLLGGGDCSFDGPDIILSALGGGGCFFHAPIIDPILSGGGYSSFERPDISIDIWSDNGRMSFKAPKFTPVVSGGGYAYFKAPKERVNITGTVNNNGSVSFTGPRIKINIYGNVDTSGWMTFPGPKMKVNIEGTVGSVGHMSFPGPKIKVNMSGYTTSGDISFSGPKIKMNMSGGLVHNYGVLKYIKGQIR